MKLGLGTALVLVSLSGGVCAEWKKAGEDEKMELFVDPSTVKTNGKFRQAWELLNRKVSSEAGGMSVRSLKQYDCKKAQVQVMSFSFHTKPWAQGEVISSHQPPENLADVPPMTPQASAMHIICAKK